MDTYCSIFIANQVTSSTLEKLADVIKGTLIKDTSIEILHNGHLDLSENLGYNELLQSQFPDGFLYFKYKLDATFNDSIKISDCIELIGIVLKFFWDNGISAVASCDYEDELPLNGGYTSTSIPWPGNNAN